MRFKWLMAGIAILAAVGIWQVRADEDSTAKKKPSPAPADLIKHGDYLVNKVAHCSHCHTALDSKGQPTPSRLLQGAMLGFAPKKKTENWAAKSPDITSSGLAGKWSEEEMIKFLTTGVNPEGAKPIPPMPVFHLNTKDARAVFLYLKSLPGSKERGKGKQESKESD